MVWPSPAESVGLRGCPQPRTPLSHHSEGLCHPKNGLIPDPSAKAASPATMPRLP